MRLAFICSGLEPGRDGVGDFARTLARHCAATGHEVRLVSVRDSLSQDRAAPAADTELRLADIFRQPAEVRQLAAWLREFQPDWASVHFTPFGFHPRGLGGRRAVFLREILPAKTRRHVMLHEIWLQPGRDGELRHRALGWAQKRCVDAWCGPGWRPEVIHTQARLHQARLQARGFRVELLPLCTNFSPTQLTREAARASVADWLRGKSEKIDDTAVWLGHFGAFHPQGWDFAEFAAKVAAHSNLTGQRACFVALGRSTAVAAIFADAAAKVPQADFRVLGELSEEKVTVAMRACDAAFTSTPKDIIEKSSAVAAWRALGIPVLVTRAGATDAEKLPPWPDAGLIDAFESNFYVPGAGALQPGPAFLNPETTTRVFLSALIAASTRP
ncbi:MAG TPA: hypothetical protein VHC95_01940 [Opitutales bacterium]|nr:hypothetical protein [Opitutales bacterium]